MSCQENNQQEILAKILSLVVKNPETGCFEYRGVKNDQYMKVSIGGKYKQVHRVVWECVFGPIPPGNIVHHVCRVLGCCNPEHLKSMTKREHVSEHRKEIAPFGTPLWRRGTRWITYDP